MTNNIIFSIFSCLVSLGVAVVITMQPGDESTRHSIQSLRKGYPSLKQENVLTAKDTVLDLWRNAFPENIYDVTHFEMFFKHSCFQIQIFKMYCFVTGYA